MVEDDEAAEDDREADEDVDDDREADEEDEGVVPELSCLIKSAARSDCI
jgi:hypothetical protein